MKKGFTLVELAIVLVVIGFILGMAIKGKSLIDAAKLRAEAATMVNAETIFIMEASKLGRYPDFVRGFNAASNAVTYLNIEGIYPNEKTFKSKYSPSNTDYYYVPTAGHFLSQNDVDPVRIPGTNGFKFSFINGSFTDSQMRANSDVMAISLVDKNFTFGTIGLPTKIYCELEVLMDDQRFYDKTGRLMWGPGGTFKNANTLRYMDFDDCSNNFVDTIAPALLTFLPF